MEWVFTTADLPDWSVNPSDFEHTASMTGIVFFDGEQSDDPSDMVAAFVGDECRGVDAQGIYFPPTGQWIWGITLYANEEGETFTFKGYDASSDSVYDYSSFSFVFVADDIIGDATNPVEWVFTSVPPIVPTVTIISPSDGAALDSEDFLVEFLTTDFTIGDAGCSECDGHVHVFVNGAPNPYGDYMVYTESPLSLSGVPNGNHSITVQLVDTGHQPFDPSIESSVNVTVFVNSAPVAEDDLYETDEDTPLNGNVLDNDSDVDGDQLGAVLVTVPSNGALDLAFNGSFTYIPNENFNGSDEFTYQADDGGGVLTCEELGFDYTDCVGTCFNNADCVNDEYDGCIEGESTWLGDGFCDDGTWGLVLVCDEYGHDCGDCGGGVPSDPNGYCSGRGENGDTNENNKIFIETDVTIRELSNVATVSIAVNSVNDAPVSDAGEDTTITVFPHENETDVALDGSGSYDIDDSIVSYVWSEEGESIASGVTADVSLSLGTHEITLTVTDESGDSSIDNVTIVIEQSESYWIPPTPTGQYHLIILGDISMSQDTLDSGLDEIGVFDGDLLVGTVICSGESGQQVLAWVDDETTDEVDGFVEGNIITFKFYDFSEGIVMESVFAEYIEFPGWNTDGLFGSGHVSGVNLLIFANALPGGWSWKGFPLVPDTEMTSEEFFGPVLDDVIIIKSQEDGSMVNIDGTWVGGDFIINNMDGYIIKMSVDASFTHPNQERIDPSEVLEMSSSWNWINYYGLGAPDAELAFADVLENLIVAESRDGALLDTPWGLINGIGNMAFTEGYLVKLSNGGSLTWPDGSSARTLASAMDVSPTQEPNHFVPIKTLSYHLINIHWADPDGMNYGDEVAVFSENICVGSVVYDGNTLQQILAWEEINSQSNDGFHSGESIQFFHWNGAEEKELNSEIDYVDFDGWSTDGTFQSSGMSGVNMTMTVLAASEEPVMPERIQLIGNFPNPFNPYTTIKYELSYDANISLVVYNSLGESVQILASGSQSAGKHNVMWNGESITKDLVPSGIYIYQLTVDGVIAGTKKMVLVK